MIEWIVAAVDMGTYAPDLYEGTSPSVIVDNGHGVYRKLLDTATFDDAVQEAGRLREELRVVGFDEWRESYGIPEDFVTRRRMPPLQMIRKLPRALWRWNRHGRTVNRSR
jgi:hypothetical protein